jgi:hypothetical protein
VCPTPPHQWDVPVDNDREETPLRSTNSPATSICNNSELPLFLPRTPTTPSENLELQDTATYPTEAFLLNGNYTLKKDPINGV